MNDRTQPRDPMATLVDANTRREKRRGSKGDGPAQSRHRETLLVLSGSAAGKMFSMSDESMTLGRGSDCEICLPDEGVSREHALLSRNEDGSVVVSDLRSTNGTYVNGTAISRHVLRDGERIEIGSAIVLKFSYQDTLEETFNLNRYRQAVYDELTGALNRRHWLNALRQELAYGLRHNQPTSVLIFDIDHFKKINDSHGHPAGDEILRRLAETIRDNVREEDVFGRYGGEEFILVLRGLDEDHAYMSAERLRRLIEGTDFEWHGQRIPVTISVGVASGGGSALVEAQKLIKEADEHLYAAKRGGRNRSVGASHR